jgi:hypothetical protein
VAVVAFPGGGFLLLLSCGASERTSRVENSTNSKEPEMTGVDMQDYDSCAHPFSMSRCHPAWKTETVLALAHGIVKEQAIDRLPILADALEEIGCDSDTVLRHCRADVNHLRSCWVLDWLLEQDHATQNRERLFKLHQDVKPHPPRIHSRAEAVSRFKKLIQFVSVVLVVTIIVLSIFMVALRNYTKRW